MEITGLYRATVIQGFARVGLGLLAGTCGTLAHRRSAVASGVMKSMAAQKSGGHKQLMRA